MKKISTILALYSIAFLNLTYVKNTCAAAEPKAPSLIYMTPENLHEALAAMTQEQLNKALRKEVRDLMDYVGTIPRKCKIIELLLTQGADPYYTTHDDYPGYDAFHLFLMHRFPRGAGYEDAYQAYDTCWGFFRKILAQKYQEKEARERENKKEIAPPEYSFEEQPPVYSPRGAELPAQAGEVEAEVKERRQQAREIACEHCTYLNPATNVSCEMCNAMFRR